MSDRSGSCSEPAATESVIVIHKRGNKRKSILWWQLRVTWREVQGMWILGSYLLPGCIASRSDNAPELEAVWTIAGRRGSVTGWPRSFEL